MVYVEERALRAFKEDFLFRDDRVVEIDDRVSEKRSDRLRRGEILGVCLAEFQRIRAERAKLGVRVSQARLQSLGEARRTYLSSRKKRSRPEPRALKQIEAAG